MAGQNVYQIVTDKIVTALQAGTIPWQKPWQGGGAGMPRNAITNRPYHGINVWLLAWLGYDDPRFLTFNQAKERGTIIRKGERGNLVVYWNFYDKKVQNDETGELEVKTTAILRYYTVFHYSQVEDVDKLRLKTVEFKDSNWNADEEAESIMMDMPNRPEIRNVRQDRAYYKMDEDTITLPLRGQFKESAEYYSTLFHELSHSTGHKSRLNRHGDYGEPFGSPVYSREELVAEFGSAFLCATSGIDNTLPNSAAYIAGWLSKLQDDPKLVVIAAAQGQRAANYILGAEAEVVDKSEQAA